MRNLRNVQRTIRHFNNVQLPLSATAWEPDNSNLICVFGPAKDDSTIQIFRLSANDGYVVGQHLIASWTAPCPNPNWPHDRVLSLKFFPESRSHCLVLAGGDIVLVREDAGSDEDRIEIVGSVDDGLAAARWSPDEEILALCTTTASLLLMSRDFDPLADIKMTIDDMKATKHVSVGWGKAETQFKGKRAKALRDPTVPEKVDEGILSTHDDGQVTISWRGDGEFLAVNSVESQKHRMIRVYAREGVLDSVSQPVDYLESALSWRPAGNLIAGVQRGMGATNVVFFERNGLRHGHFPLRIAEEKSDSESKRISLEWNTDSSVLAVVLDAEIQFWTMGNYHYYLKQTINMSPTSIASASVSWNTENPLLVACHASNTLSVHQYIFDVRHGSTVAPQDTGTVGVIDGAMLKLTSFRFANIPPPMSQSLIEIDENIIDVCINSTAGLIAILCRTKVSLYRYSPRKTKSADKVVATIHLPATCKDWYQVELSNDGYIFILGYLPNQGEAVFKCAFSETDLKFLPITDERGSNNLTTLAMTLQQDAVLAATSQGYLHSLSSSFHPSTLLANSRPCPWVCITTIEGNAVAFGLAQDGSLFANDQLLAQHCTSFIVTTSHLIFTTAQHYLKFVHLNSQTEFDIPRDEPEVDERCRSIERGAKIVLVMPSIYALVLQMPRGNLETIYPRALVLAAIRNAVDAIQYESAFLICRAHRVDMNILYDHKPDLFMASIDEFITQVSKVEHIDLFLSQLREEDVSRTMYRDTDTKRQSNTITSSEPISQNSTNKINIICDAFLDCLGSKSDSHLQNIITAHVSKSPPDLDGGLTIISHLKQKGDDVAERAAEHICFLTDVNRLYDHALGIYDLDVALLIAQNSQKDPREYVPYVQALQEMSQLRRQYTIDDDLSRRRKALGHLHAMDEFEELKQYTEKHELHSAAIELYKYQPERLRDLMRLHADFLDSRNRYKDAALAYEFLEDYNLALPAYRAANLWRETLSTAAMIPLSDEAIKSIANELIEGLEEAKDHQAVATIYLDYLDDLDHAVEHLCTASQFAEAMRLIARYKAPHLLKTTFDAGLTERFTSVTELLSECKGQINAQTGRLKELRLKKEQEPLAFYAGESAAATNGDIPDDISLASTNASTSGGTFMTRYTNRSDGTLNTQTTHKTSKNRKREERKRARGKKGTIYEEEYLVNSLTRLVERVNSVNEDIARLVDALVRRGKREEARVVEAAMIEVVNLCQEMSKDVYGSSATAQESQEDTFKQTGADAVLADAIELSRQVKVAPVILKFERLSLLE